MVEARITVHAHITVHTRIMVHARVAQFSGMVVGHSENMKHNNMKYVKFLDTSSKSS